MPSLISMVLSKNFWPILTAAMKEMAQFATKIPTFCLVVGKHDCNHTALREAQDSALQAVSPAELSASVCACLRLIYPLRSWRLCGSRCPVGIIHIAWGVKKSEKSLFYIPILNESTRPSKDRIS